MRDRDGKNFAIIMEGFFGEEFCATFVESSEKEETLRELCDLAASKMENAISSEALYEKVIRRELTGSTGIGDGVAIPHIMVEENKRLITVLGISKKGIDYHAPDGKLVQILLLSIGNRGKRSEMLRGLARAARIARRETFRKKAIEAANSSALSTLFFSYETKPVG